MNEQQLKQLSSLIDLEESDSAMIDAICTDKSLQKAWGRYNLIRDCLRENVPEYVDYAFIDRIKVHLQNKTAFVRKSNAWHRFFYPAISVAALALFAAALFFSLQQHNFDSGATEVAGLAISENRSNPTVDYPKEDMEVIKMPRVGQVQLKLEYDYAMHRLSSGVSSISPYIAVMAYDFEK